MSLEAQKLNLNQTLTLTVKNLNGFVEPSTLKLYLHFMTERFDLPVYVTYRALSVVHSIHFRGISLQT
jgi:hypothetical protein